MLAINNLKKLCFVIRILRRYLELMTITIRFKLKSPDLFTDDDKPEDDPVDDPNDSEGLSRSFVTSTLLANDNKKKLL